MLVNVEIRMNSQMAAAFGFMEPSTLEIGIGDQSFDAGKFLQKGEERLTVELSEQVSDEPGGNLLRRELIFVPFLITIKIRLVLARRKLVDDASK